MEHTPLWKAEPPAVAVSPVDGADEQRLFDLDRRLQRRAMLAMLAAMATMLAGLPLHLPAVTGMAHGVGGLFGWVAATLATLALAAALPMLRPGATTRLLGRGEQALVLCCAASAYALGWAGLLAENHMLLYFDVAAMSVAALAEGRALELDVRRRAVAVAEQLAPISGETCPRPIEAALRGVALPLAVVLTVGASLAAARAGSAGQPIVAALATVAACCPCALGRARVAALAAASEPALRNGWIVASAQSLVSEQPWRGALAVPNAERASLAALARSARRAAQLNVLWAVMVPAALLPLALRGPLDPLLPAAAMVVAWSASGLTNRLLLGRHSIA